MAIIKHIVSSEAEISTSISLKSLLLLLHSLHAWVGPLLASHHTLPQTLLEPGVAPLTALNHAVCLLNLISSLIGVEIAVRALDELSVAISRAGPELNHRLHNISTLEPWLIG